MKKILFVFLFITTSVPQAVENSAEIKGVYYPDTLNISLESYSGMLSAYSKFYKHHALFDLFEVCKRTVENEEFWREELSEQNNSDLLLKIHQLMRQ